MNASDRALEVLLSDELRHVVDMVIRARDGLVEAHAHDGAVGFRRDGTVEWTRGRNPLANQDPAARSPLDAELKSKRPSNGENHYPHAYDNIAQLFENPCAPDLAVVHTPAHNWEGPKGGHRGEHGSPNVVQARAPLILSGTGINKRGMIPRSARMIDVAPTLLRLAGLAAETPLEDLIEQTPQLVVAFLCDGTNANVLYAMAGAGELPNVARLMSEGTTFAHGLIASFPTVTLANHTTALTGAHPGTHGVLHNWYYDRAAKRSIDTNSPETWHLARDEISRDVKTVFEQIEGFTAAVNEPVDRGASYTTFDLVRRAGGFAALAGSVPSPEDVPGTTKEFVDRKREYGFSSSADHLAVQQATQLWQGANGNPRPKLMWINLILPDAANHAGGPYSDIGHAGLRDTDARLGQILDAMDWGGGETAFMLLADHGMEESDPECRGDFDEALEKAGIAFRDEGYGFIYLRERAGPRGA